MRRTALFGTIERIGVSIHASVKDATTSDNAIKLSGLVSIHASVKDATKSIIFIDAHIGVSIHASVKDATKRLQTYSLPPVFQSTHL